MNSFQCKGNHSMILAFDIEMYSGPTKPLKFRNVLWTSKTFEIDYGNISTMILALCFGWCWLKYKIVFNQLSWAPKIDVVWYGQSISLVSKARGKKVPDMVASQLIWQFLWPTTYLLWYIKKDTNTNTNNLFVCSDDDCDDAVCYSLCIRDTNDMEMRAFWFLASRTQQSGPFLAFLTWMMVMMMMMSS